MAVGGEMSMQFRRDDIRDVESGGQTPSASSYEVADIEKFIQQTIFTRIRGLAPTVPHNLQLRTQINITATSTRISHRLAGQLLLFFKTLKGAQTWQQRHLRLSSIIHLLKESHFLGMTRRINCGLVLVAALCF